MATQQNTSMISEVSICNQALSWLGQTTIVSLDDPSTEAEWMDNNYFALRDAVLEERMWTFATVRFTSTSSVPDAFGIQFVHNLPPEWLTVFRVYRKINSSDRQDWIQSVGWSVETNTVLAREETIFMVGLIRVTDTGKFTNLFAQALAARIAADAAIAFTENRQLQADMWALYAAKLSEAAVRDGQQGSNEQVLSSVLVNARYGGGDVRGING